MDYKKFAYLHLNMPPGGWPVDARDAFGNVIRYQRGWCAQCGKRADAGSHICEPCCERARARHRNKKQEV